MVRSSFFRSHDLRIHRFAEVLRHSAELTMHKLVEIVFSKLHDLDPESEEKKLSGSQPPGTDQPPPPVDQPSGDGATASEPVTTPKSKKKKKKKPIPPTVQSPPDVCVLQKSECMSFLFPNPLFHF